MIIKSKLKFKGAVSNSSKNHTRGHHKAKKDDQAKEEIKTEDSKWCKVEFLEDLQGPATLVDTNIGCLLVFPESGKPLLRPVEIQNGTTPIEPQNIDELLVLHHREANAISLKTSYGKLISSDSLGTLICTKEAVGVTEEWFPELVMTDQGTRIALKNKAYGTYLHVDKVKRILRADGDEPGTGLLISAQKKYMKTFKKNEEKRDHQLTSNQEILTFEKDQRNLLQSSSNNECIDLDLNELEQANSEGRLRERMLERRIRRKHDPYC